MKKKSVWLIEDGCYSDYHVIGVYSTRERALSVADHFGLGKDSVYEWDLDPVWDEINRGLMVFQVTMLWDGKAESVEAVSRDYGPTETKHFFWDRPNAPAYKGKNISAAVSATVWARSKKHAIKIVNEIRAQMIARGEWKSYPGDPDD